ncbi:MAG: O-antigen ligase family protein [Cellvibrionales bacterium]|nr:O-antigen ligase family protein [Cellvibrionales bacterium]
MNDAINKETTPVQRAYGAALTTYIASLAFFSPSESHFLYYFLSLVMFIFVGLAIAKNKIEGVLHALYRKHRKWFVILILWLVASTLSLIMVWSNDSTENLQRGLSLIRHVYDISLLGLVFVLARLQALRIIDVKALFFALALGFSVMLGLEIIIYHQVAIDAKTWFESPPLGLHVRDQGNLACVIAVSMAAYWAVKPPTKIAQKIVLSTALCIGLSFVYWSGGRMAITATLITLLILSGFIFYTRQPHKYQWLLLIILSIAVSVLIAECLSVYPWNGIGRTLHDAQTVSTAAVDNANNAQMLNQVTTGRATMWKISLKAFSESPWLGLGPYGYFFIPEELFGDQPHNFIIQFLVEWGILGAVCLLLLLAACFVFILQRMTKAFQQQDACWVMAASVICVLTLHGLTGGTYFMAQPLSFLAIAFSVPLAKLLRAPSFSV